jgi:hypothetical protein
MGLSEMYAGENPALRKATFQGELYFLFSSAVSSGHLVGDAYAPYGPIGVVNRDFEVQLLILGGDSGAYPISGFGLPTVRGVPN